MKRTIKTAIFLLMVLIGQQSLYAQKTIKIWVVRHAEKLTDNPNDKDPDLSNEGKERAQALARYLRGQNIDTIYASNYKRTKLTGFPLADQIGISVKTYDVAKQKELAKELITYAAGKKIVIIGHSNTVLEIIADLGGTKPVKELTDDDYDYIFEINIKGNKVDVKTDRYGLAHHSKQEQ